MRFTAGLVFIERYRRALVVLLSLLVFATATVPFERAEAANFTIASSTRFNDDDSADLSKTLTTATDSKKFTLSTWVKRGNLGTSGATIMAGGSGTSYALAFNGSGILGGTADYLTFLSSDGGATVRVSSNNLFRDPAKWMHVVLVVDTTQGTASNRAHIYVDGTEVSYLATTYPSQDANAGLNTATAHRIGSWLGAVYLDGYVSDFYFIDGQALGPTYFGHTDANRYWRPKRYSGTYGANGFHLPLMGTSTAAGIGLDTSGNGNDWTVNNIATTDFVKDSPTNNFATMNPLQNESGMTLSSGNLNLNGSTAQPNTVSTIGIPASGKWYFEAVNGSTNNSNVAFGVGLWINGTTVGPGYLGETAFWFYSSASGVLHAVGTTGATGLTAAQAGEVFQVAIDSATGKVWVGRSDVWYNSTGGTTGNPATGANPTYTLTAAQIANSMPFNELYANTAKMNFGQGGQSSLTYDSPSGGWFKYTPPSGFKALSTANLPTSTIPVPKKYFDVLTWTGDGNSSRNITGLGFQSSFSWIKNRSAAISHLLYDSVRGAGTIKALCSDTTVAEGSCSDTATYGYLDSFISTGLAIVKGSSDATSYTNLSSQDYVAWNWKESATSGFDIVTYTGDGASSKTIFHALGATPALVIHKSRNATGGWPIYHQSLGATGAVQLESTGAFNVSSTYWNDTVPNSSAITVGSGLNTNGTTYLMYAFAEIPGFSKFGSYTGNGSTDGPFVYTGFKPRYVIIKRTDAVEDWITLDSARNTLNPATTRLEPNTADAEATQSNLGGDFLVNGLKLRGDALGVNASGGSYIYAAFAEQPFKLSAMPGTSAETTARIIRLWRGVRILGGTRLF